MHKFSRYLLAILFLAGAVNHSMAATTRITASVSVTNTAGTTNGQTIAVNGSTRTFTNNVVLPAVQILTNSTAAGTKTNMTAAIGLAPFLSVVQVDKGATNFDLVGNSGASLTVTLSAGWATVSYSTQVVAAARDVRIPYDIEAAQQQTNITSGLVAAIDSPPNTNSIHESSTVALNLVGRSNVQSISGNKYFSGTSNFLNAAYLKNPVLTNGVNYGTAFSSKGSGTGSEQFGSGANASGNTAIALGNGATASGQSSVALGRDASASGDSSIAIGNGAIAEDNNAIAIGGAASKPGSAALGLNSSANHTNSTAVGANAATTADNQVMIGAAGINAVINNWLHVGGGLTVANGVTNLLFTGTNSFPAGSAISYGRKSISSLANGANADIVVGTNIVCDVSGPTGAFTINGAVPVYSGQVIYVVNLTGQNMTIAHDSGVEPTAANRIWTLTGADIASTGNGAVMLWYNSNVSRWIAFWVQQ